jgi:hypothetical protein
VRRHIRGFAPPFALLAGEGAEGMGILRVEPGAGGCRVRRSAKGSDLALIDGIDLSIRRLEDITRAVEVGWLLQEINPAVIQLQAQGRRGRRDRGKPEDRKKQRQDHVLYRIRRIL